MGMDSEHFHVFLSYSHRDADWVENLARQLEDSFGFRVWLDKWILIPGEPWQPAMARGLEVAGCCAVCVGEHTPQGWFKQEIMRALNRQAKETSFRVIPVLLPRAQDIDVEDFLELRTWVSFRNGSDPAYALHLLKHGIEGTTPGRWSPAPPAPPAKNAEIEEKLRELSNLREASLIDHKVAMRLQYRLVAQHFDIQG